jgi:hypothetical protein
VTVGVCTVTAGTVTSGVVTAGVVVDPLADVEPSDPVLPETDADAPPAPAETEPPAPEPEPDAVTPAEASPGVVTVAVPPAACESVLAAPPTHADAPPGALTETDPPAPEVEAEPDESTLAPPTETPAETVGLRDVVVVPPPVAEPPEPDESRPPCSDEVTGPFVCGSEGAREGTCVGAEVSGRTVVEAVAGSATLVPAGR